MPRRCGNFEDQIFFQQAAAAYCAKVPAAVTGIDHNAQLGHAGAQLQIFFGGRRNDDGQLIFFRLGRIRKQVDRGFGSRTDLAHFDHEAVRIRLEAYGES